MPAVDSGVPPRCSRWPATAALLSASCGLHASPTQTSMNRRLAPQQLPCTASPWRMWPPARTAPHQQTPESPTCPVACPHWRSCWARCPRCPCSACLACWGRPACPHPRLPHCRCPPPCRRCCWAGGHMVCEGWRQRKRKRATGLPDLTSRTQQPQQAAHLKAGRRLMGLRLVLCQQYRRSAAPICGSEWQSWHPAGGGCCGPAAGGQRRGCVGGGEEDGGQKDEKDVCQKVRMHG